MTIRREWLDWSKPCLPAAAAWLIQRAASAEPQTNAADNSDDQQETAGACDLRSTICVLPSRRAGRLLLGELLQQCRASGLSLPPPRLLTPGPMVDELLDLRAPLASGAEVIFAWMKALQEIKHEAIAPLLPIRPEQDDVLAWRALAITIAGLHAELAGQRLTFAAVADQAERIELLAEGERWQALEAVHGVYQRQLVRSELVDPHRARLDSLKKSTARAASLVLIGVVELNDLQRAVVASFGERCTALVHAPQSLGDRFDDLGCVIPPAWAETRIELDDEQIHIADRPSDQAQQAIRAIAGLNGDFAAPQITIGLGDESMSAVIERHAQWAGLTARSAIGRPLRHSGPYRLLEVAAEWLSDRRFANFAALLRHPDIEAWLRHNPPANPKFKIQNPQSDASDWLTLLDRYFCDHLQERITATWLGDSETSQCLALVHQAIERLLAPLATESRLPIADWSGPIIDVLSSLYGDADQTGDNASLQQSSLEACQALGEVLAEFSAAPQSLQPRVTAADGLRLLLKHAAGLAIVEELRPDQMEMLGWLELHLDTAPALIITGFNDGFIPQSSAGDPFLPDSLRGKLGLSTNASRCARDAYWIQAIRASRPHLTIIAGRHSAQGDPLTPSRLLLACDPETLLRRVRFMCDEASDRIKLLPVGMDDLAAAEVNGSQFLVPDLPQPLAPPTYMRVTDFSRYLECPYRYALARLLDLEGISDEALELDPMQFGLLLHDVLCEFGNDPSVAHCQESDVVEKFLLNALGSRTPGRFGRHPMPAVQVQIARAAQRLRSFARCQVELCKDGWRIEHCEYAFKQGIALDIPGQQPMTIHGKIDRIDRNQQTGQWMIIDYKTGESGESPHKSHHGVERLSSNCDLPWQDLQLPLYHYLVKQAMTQIDGEIALGYICLPQQTDGARLKLAQWTDEHLRQAIDLARTIVRDIRAAKFDLNHQFEGRFDPFSRICHSSVFGQPVRAGGEA